MESSKTIIRRLLPAAAALALFFVVSAVYFAPQFRGEVLPQHDVVQYDGMAKDINDMREATGEDPQWTGRMFGGMPAYLINVAYPAQLVKNTLGRVVKIIDTPAAFLFFAMTAMWLMLLIFGVNPWVGVVASLAYGLSTYFLLIIGAGHITKMWALVYAPLMMGGAWMTLRGNMWAGGALTALTASLEIGANHPQITYYFLLAMAAFWISEGVTAFREKHFRNFALRTAVLAAAGLLAVGSNFSPLWYTAKHSKETMRGGSELASTAETSKNGLALDYATAWSYGRTESLNLLVPDFMGRESGTAFAPDGEVAAVLNDYGLRGAAQQLPAYWGTQPYTGGPTYLGAAAVFLAALGIALARGRNKWWIIAACVVMILLAWGRNLMGFTEFAFKYLPGYNKFRTVSMALVVVQWTVPLLAALALGILIYLVYRKFYTGVVYSRSFAVTLVGMCVLTCMVTLAISTNVVISLGMVGALSIVRFRTAVKDPLDLLYLFWSITTGITAGAGMYALGLVTAAVMIAMIYLFSHWQAKGRVYIAVIHYVGTEAGDDIVRALGRIKYAVKSKTMRGENTEMAVEVFCKDPNMEFADRIRAVKGVQDVTLIQYNGEYHG